LRKHLPRIISREEVKRLLEAPQVGCPTGLRNRVALELMYHAGLRVSEIADLKPASIRWQTGEVLVRGKGDKDRVVPFANGTLGWLRLWEQKRPKAKTFLCTLKGGRLSRQYLGEMVVREAAKAGIERKVSPHTLRHCFASEKIEDGFTLPEVAALLGHISVQTTAIYLHANPKALRDKIQGAEKKPDAVAELKAKAEKLLARIAELEGGETRNSMSIEAKRLG
jgi:integrase/recombinase XerD